MDLFPRTCVLALWLFAVPWTIAFALEALEVGGFVFGASYLVTAVVLVLCPVLGLLKVLGIWRARHGEDSFRLERLPIVRVGVLVLLLGPNPLLWWTALRSDSLLTLAVTGLMTATLVIWLAEAIIEWWLGAGRHLVKRDLANALTALAITQVAVAWDWVLSSYAAGQATVAALWVIVGVGIVAHLWRRAALARSREIPLNAGTFFSVAFSPFKSLEERWKEKARPSQVEPSGASAADTSAGRSPNSKKRRAKQTTRRSKKRRR